jgi:hypothetical protein
MTLMSIDDPILSLIIACIGNDQIRAVCLQNQLKMLSDVSLHAVLELLNDTLEYSMYEFRSLESYTKDYQYAQLKVP